MKKFTIIPMLALALCSCKGNSIQEENFKTAFRGFYLWRCGTEVDADYNGNHYHIDACHLQDARTAYIDADKEVLSDDELAANQNRKDGTGGWHDAGDYGKYTVNAGITMGMLYYAWDHFADKIKKIDLELPQTAPAFPQYLQELKWENDFLMKMEYADGSGRVSHKLTRRSFAPFIMPMEDHEDRFFTVWSSAATADYAAMMAMASVRFRPYDSAYADLCLEAARRSYAFLEEHPEDKLFQQGDFSTGSYWTTDPDDRLWACAEMWNATGERHYLQQLEAGLCKLLEAKGYDSDACAGVDDDWDWGGVDNLAVWTYALSSREGRDQQLQQSVVNAIIASADRLVQNAAADPYGCALTRYYWGCNGTACRQAMNLHIADMFCPKAEYQQTIQGISEYILGNNHYGRSFVTGVGVNPPMFPHDRRSAADGIDDPWPGYLVGGGHTPTDWVDQTDDYSRNEIAINWQGALVYLLAAVL